MLREGTRPCSGEVGRRPESWTIVALAALLTALAALAAPRSAAAIGACEVERHAQAERVPSHRAAGGAPLVIGDSTSLLAAPTLGHLGLEADAHGCRQFFQGVELLAQRRRAGRLPRVVVLALGANGPIREQDLRTALRLLGPQRVLVLVTARHSPQSVAAMKRAARAHPTRIVLADWVRFSSGHEAWFAGDGLHVGDEGAAAYAHFIRDAVAPLAFPPVRELRLPRSTRQAKSCGLARRHGGLHLRVSVVRGGGRVLCERARELARMPPLRPAAGWRTYDWRGAHAGPWDWVTVRADGEVAVAAVVAA